MADQQRIKLELTLQSSLQFSLLLDRALVRQRLEKRPVRHPGRPPSFLRTALDSRAARCWARFIELGTQVYVSFAV